MTAHHLASNLHLTQLQLLSGDLYPLGANVVIDNENNQGVNFSVYSPQAKQVYLCLFDESGEHQVIQLSLFKGEQHIWHGKVVGIGAGQLYGFRVEGDYNPEIGLRFNQANLLIDPYAKDLQGEFAYEVES